MSFGQDSNGNWGYKIGGADPVYPFKKMYEITGVAAGWRGTCAVDLKTVCNNWKSIQEKDIKYGILSFDQLGGSAAQPGKLTKVSYVNGVLTLRVDADLRNCNIGVYFSA